MSVLINGMEMPKDEAVALYIYPDGRAKLWRPQAAVSHEFEAVPVPPHGRLGDLDEIVRYKERLVVDADKIIPEIRYVVDTKYIVDAPTIIEAEEG